MKAPLWLWLAVLGVILAMLLDLFMHRNAHVISVREAAVWSAVWVLLGVAFGGVLWSAHGADIGQQYFAGYLIEKSGVSVGSGNGHECALGASCTAGISGNGRECADGHSCTAGVGGSGHECADGHSCAPRARAVRGWQGSS